MRDLEDQTDHSRNNIEENVSCRPIRTRKQENAFVAEAKIAEQYHGTEFKISMKEERSSRLKNFVLTALMKDIVPAVAKAKEATSNVRISSHLIMHKCNKLTITRYKSRV